MSTYSEILYAVDNGTATITLNRPDHLNAWTNTMACEVADAITDAAQDDAVKAIILTGAGRGFCAGADMQNLQGLSQGAGGGEQRRATAPDFILQNDKVDAAFKHPFTYFPAVPKPIIAAINGPVAGLGLVIALYADIRLVAKSAVFTMAFSKRGLIAEYGAGWLLPRLVGQANALDLLFSSRKVYGPEATQMGLANRCVEDDVLIDEARAYAAMLATEVSPRSLQVMKTQVYAAQEESFADHLNTAVYEMQQSLKSDDFKEGVAHFLEKRAPNFSGKY